MMRLYHGSNVGIEKVNLDLCQPYKDFGQGFYMTDIEKQAVDMALRTSRILREGHPIVTVFDFDEDSAVKAKLKIKRFESTTREWAMFIINNRDRKNPRPFHDYDIVMGPVADDNIAAQLYDFRNGDISVDTLVHRLKFAKTSTQFFFHTPRALQYLQRLWTYDVPSTL